ncbi:MAG: dihydrolipoamide acetyltransferase family protein [Caldilineaceae bacterium]
MTTAVKMPQLGESVVEGTVALWLKAPGEPVAKYEPLLEISTDKIDTEIPSPAAGTLLEIVAAEGETVAVGAVLAYIGEPGDQPETTAARPQPEPAAASVSASPANVPVTAPIIAQGAGAKPVGRAFISPVVARMAEEHAIDLEEVTGSGLGGRITKKDLLAFMRTQAEEAEQLSAPPSASSTPSASAEAVPSVPVAPQVDASDEVLQPFSAMRRAIAQHMVLSKQTSPHVTTVFEIDMTAVVRHREAQKAMLAARGVSLTFTPYFVAAATAALRAVPVVNSRYTPDGLLLKQRIHIGIAVALADGLIVPVIRDTDEKNLQGLARAVNDLATRARTGKLAPDELKGGTFTLTNHGVTGSLFGTPIINQPQTGILGIGAIGKRPVVRSATPSLLPSADDALVIRPMCYVSFSFDHRVVDGATADAFLTVIRSQLEEWPE